MNEEVNFCDQCGSKINSDAKFCSNCGHDLKNSSTKITLDHKVTLDKPIKVEVTNATVEKGFKAVEKGFKAMRLPSKSHEPRMTIADAIIGHIKALRLPPHEPRMTIADAIKGLIKALVLIGFIVYLYWIIVSP